MITKQELKKVLQKYKFSEKEIERILHKKNKYFIEDRKYKKY